MTNRSDVAALAAGSCGEAMNMLACMQPRHPRAAARSLSALFLVGGGVALATAPVQPRGLAAGGLLAAALVVVIGCLAFQGRRIRAANALAWAVVPLLSVPLIAGLDLVTRDAGVGAQMFFLFPVLYAASQLRPLGAAVMTGLAVLGEVVVVVVLLPAEQAFVDGLGVTAVLVTTSVSLVIASERHARLVDRLRHTASVDPLTGLTTRRVLDDAAARTIGQAPGGTLDTSLLLIDVDHFKEINDRFGHPAGDQVLEQLAGLLLARVRGTDVASRLGGDELALLLPRCDYATALRRAQDILFAVENHTFRLDDGRQVEVSISVGCAHVATHGTDLRSLYHAADSALYRAKRAGRGRVATPAAAA